MNGGNCDQKLFRFQDKKKRQSNNKELPADNLWEILSILPIKSLCRFKCVSKTWYNLLLDSQFVKLHLQQSINANKLTYTLYETHKFHRRLELGYEALVNGQAAKPTRDHSLLGPKVRGKKFTAFDVWGSCNGLLCIYAAPTPSVLVLANPSTKESKMIFRFYPQSKSIYSIGGGFGYDAMNDDYKVVKINCRIRRVDVYSLKNDSWSYKGNFPSKSAFILGSASVHLNGAIHWIDYDYVQNHVSIIAFDLTKEEFFHMPTPIVRDSCYDLHASRGCLCMSPRWSRSDFWIMETYGVKESWKNIRLKFSYHHFRALDVNFPKSKEALYLVNRRLFRENGELEEVNLGPASAGYLSSGLNVALSYVESLVSLGTTGMPKPRKQTSGRKRKAEICR